MPMETACGCIVTIYSDACFSYKKGIPESIEILIEIF